MDISTLQSLLDSHAQVLGRIRCDDMFESESDIDYNYALGVEHGFKQAIRLIKDALETELRARDNDAQWIDFVVRSAIENNTFDGECKYSMAFYEAYEELDVDYDTLNVAFDRVKEAA